MENLTFGTEVEEIIVYYSKIRLKLGGDDIFTKGGN